MSTPTAAIVAVGDELLQGIVVNTNAALIGQRLQAVGIHVGLSVAVGDVTDDIVEVLRGAAERHDVVIVTGGLGPTQDDRTRDAFSKLLGTPLRRHEHLVEMIRERMSRFGRRMADSNLKQADIPEGAEPIPNPWGTAPGIRAECGRAVLYAIPGIPSEAEHLLDEVILPEVAARLRTAIIRTRDVRSFGVAESELAERLSDLAEAINPRMAFLPGGGILRLRFVATGATADECDVLLDECERIVRERCGVSIFGAGDESLEGVVGTLLKAKGLTVATAESCTAGLVSARLASVPGASAWLRGGIVAYSRDVKARALGISGGLLEAVGAVSGEVALEMALGARVALEADVGVSVTCAAGPDPQDGAAPGTTYIALSAAPRTAVVRELHLPGERDLVRTFATASVLNLLRLHLLGETLR